ncbi:class II aldolase/adducin family protein [Phytoactinopolyspora endophytica]|uniref:class II aldolase/adducin family protein n=1 Tax=Phytoactinopolyspora endophytica TaxID=1642495 RepID=UPI00101C3126|nr:class II aldolase/adducin family protein [Phytoactinopolyspora endophytica]
MSGGAVRELVSTGCRVLAANGHSDLVWGHLSARDPDGRGVWLKRAGLGFDEIGPDDVQLLSWDGELLAGQGPVHLEHHIHIEVLRARRDVAAVVHSHPEAAVALAATGLALQPVGHEATFFTPPDVPRFDRTGDLIRTSELGAEVAGVIGPHNAALLVNHGVVVAESSVERAVFGAVVLEKACRAQLLAVSAVGADRLIASPDEEALAKRERCYSARQVSLGWQYLVRSLPGPAAAGVTS